MHRDPFKDYIKQSEPSIREKGYAWHTAIGLQSVDGLKPSKYLIHTAIKNIEGEISIEDAQELLNTYYEQSSGKDGQNRTEEADKVSLRIAKLLSEKAFSFTPNEYISIHKKLFTGIYRHAGSLRDYNITKKEWVLDGATVLYGSASELRTTLEYDFSEEKKNFVIGILKIDKIKLDYPILSEVSEDLLKIAPCRFAGPLPNSVGNLCIAGHNYLDNTFFARISSLKIGDEFAVYGLDGKALDYKIFDKKEVESTDLSCTSQETNGKKIVTLMTCNSIKQTRIILQAENIE